MRDLHGMTMSARGAAHKNPARVPSPSGDGGIAAPPLKSRHQKCIIDTSPPDVPASSWDAGSLTTRRWPFLPETPRQGKTLKEQKTLLITGHARWSRAA